MGGGREEEDGKETEREVEGNKKKKGRNGRKGKWDGCMVKVQVVKMMVMVIAQDV